MEFVNELIGWVVSMVERLGYPGMGIKLRAVWPV